MTSAEVAQLREMSRQVIVQIHSRQRRHPRIVVGAKGERQGAATGTLGFERGNQRASDPPSPVFLSNDDWMELPDTAVVFRKTPYPTDENVALDRTARKSVGDDSSDLFTTEVECRPSTRFPEALDEQSCGLLANILGFGDKIDDRDEPRLRDPSIGTS